MPSQTAVLAFLSLFTKVSAWGNLGHTTVALIAQNFVSPRTTQFAQQLLNDSSSTYLGNIATWADSYRSTPEGAFSSPLHYIDALDTPPLSCNVDYERDCPEEGCIVSALANYTVRVTAKGIPIAEKAKALKWVVHFLGDVHQPLHVENLEVGGNGINVTFGGAKTNLHHIWDSNIPEKLRGGNGIGDSKKWAAELTKEINKGKFAKSRKSWLDGMSIRNPVDSTMVWARETNAYVCSAVVPQGEEAVKNQELSGSYYDKAVPVVEAQVAKAGYRLAAWLDLIVGEQDDGHGNGHGRGNAGKKEAYRLAKNAKRKIELEPWMVEARKARRAASWLCVHDH
ncbi:uncharacterized protein EI97DRAFT_457740 [Westerdykella ornata]|uniref:Nuclease PA3 n=1 Tax=Westerdykella ornata TaxID=318751 RepID=A0A6A6JKK0_WESOR|nr:uncharacterized protein EI97DRAFT_457740 [Westerdykella ornata]KAF2277002.1 hypothetical protein EI97DRAFT_457740 [Westerdykella ornata]